MLQHPVLPHPRFFLVAVSLFLTLGLHAAKPGATKPGGTTSTAIAAESSFRCPGDPACPMVEFTAAEGISGDHSGTYLGETPEGKKVGTWVDGDHSVKLELLSGWGRWIEFDFTTPVAGASSQGRRQTYDAHVWVERVTISGTKETVTGKLCELAIGASGLAQAWILIRDDQEKYWKVFYDRLPNYGGDYVTVLRLDARTFTISSTADQRARLYWQAKGQGKAKDVDKGYFAMPFRMTVQVDCQ